MLSSIASLLPDRMFVASIAYAHRRFEPELGRVVASCPRAGTAIDVGAWYGPWTYWLSRRASHVVAFEPNPDVAAVLDRTRAANVRLERAAASAHTGRAVLALPDGGRGTEGRASLEGLSDSVRSVDVETCRLDDLDVDDVVLVKIDVEGHERETLLGAEHLLARWHPLLVVEIEERHGGIGPTVDLLRSWGYRGRVLVDGDWVALDDFDLAAAQQAYQADRHSAGYLGMMMRKKARYVNNVVFSHSETSWDVT
jgi:FkbM family methyltransferase